MIFVYITLLLLGALPMAIVLLKRKRYIGILQQGIKTTAAVTEVSTKRYYKGGTYDRILFAYLPPGASQYVEGQINTKVGKHKAGENIEILYMPKQPQQYAIPGSTHHLFALGFAILILLFVIFACFKIREMIQAENPTYNTERR